MPNRPLSALIEALSRDSRVRHNTTEAVSYLLDLLYYGEFRIFEQVSSSIDNLDTINLVGVKSGPHSQGAPLWLVSCVGTGSDPVPSNWASTGGDMFKPRVDRATGMLHGLGANSGKVDFMLKVLAASRLNAMDLKRPIAVIGLFNEETRSTGLRALIEGRPAPAAALVGAPTNLELWTRHPGCIALRLEVSRRVRHRRMPPTRGIFNLSIEHGASSHAQWAPRGTDSVTRGLDLLATLRAHGDLRVLMFDAGEGGNRAGAGCSMTVATSYDELPPLPRHVSVNALGDGVSLPFPVDALMKGWLKAHDAASSAVHELMAANPSPMSKTLRREHVGWLASGRDMMAGVVTFWTGPGQTGRTQELVEAFARSAQQALTGQEELELSIQVLQDRPAFEAPPERRGPLYEAFDLTSRDNGITPVKTSGRLTTDAGLLAAAGAETIVFGPGNGGALYRDDEGVPMRQIEAALALYEGVLARWCL